MAGPYQEDGTTIIDLPRKFMEWGYSQKEVQEAQEKRKEIIKGLENPSKKEMGFDFDTDFETEEIYIDNYGRSDPTLEITGEVDGIYVSLSIPLIKGNKGLERLTKDLIDAMEPELSVDLSSSGMWLDSDDVAEKRLKTADGQGRINLGKRYAGEDVEVVVLNG